MKPLRQILQAALIGIVFVTANAQSTDQAKTDSGAIQGSTQDGVTSFKGIPMLRRLSAICAGGPPSPS
jgi:hypothetical protein